MEYFLTSFYDPNCCLPGSGGRPGRSTGFQSRSTGRSIDVHRPVHVGQAQGSVDRLVDRPESFALCFWAVDRTVDWVPPTVIFMTVGSRPGGRPPGMSGCQISLTASFCFGLYKPHLIGILAKVFTREKF